MLFYLIPESILCFIFTMFLYFRFAKKEVSFIVKLVTIVVWYFTFVTIILIPNDIALIKDNPESEKVSEMAILKFVYQVIYWTIFGLSWVVVPLLTEYEASGEFTSNAKWKAALVKNMMFILISGAIGILLIIYLVMTGQLNLSNVSGFMIDMSNGWGLLLIIFLLGYGVVMAPKHLARLGNYDNRLTYLEWKASELEGNLLGNTSDLTTYGYRFQSTVYSKKFEIDTERIEEIWRDLKLHNIHLNTKKRDEKPVETQAELIELNQLLKFAIDNQVRLQCEKITIYEEWQFLRRLLSKELTPLTGINSINKHFYLNIRPILLIGLVLAMIILSIIITISEVTLFLPSSYCLFGMFIIKSSDIFVLHLCTLIPLALLFYLSFYALFKLKLSGYFGMYPNRQTDASSLLFISKAMCKIGIPLCINFIQMIKLKNSKTILEMNYGAASSQIMVNKQFVLLCPAFLLLLILLHYYDVFEKVGNYFGFISFGFKQSFDEEKIEDGREFLLKRQREVLGDEKVDLFI